MRGWACEALRTRDQTLGLGATHQPMQCSCGVWSASLGPAVSQARGRLNADVAGGDVL